MQTVEWTPRLFLAACALAFGVVAQAAPDASSDAAGTDDASAAPGDATTIDACPGYDASSSDDAPGPSVWPGPPTIDGSLDDGGRAAFTAGDAGALAFLGISSQDIPAPFDYTTVTAPYPDAASCMAFDAQGHPAVHTCLCQKCFGLTQQCDALAGCRAIFKCFEDSGCNSLSSCFYVGSPAPCFGVINTAGGSSVSSDLATNLLTCAMTNACPAK